MRAERKKDNRASDGERGWSAAYAEPMWLPICISFFLHLALAVILVVSPSVFSNRSTTPSVISVTMVSLPGPPGPSGSSQPEPPAPKPDAEVKPSPKPAPEPAPEPPAEKTVVVKKKEPPVKKAPENVISVSKKKDIKPKKSLKKKTFKPSSVVKKAIRRIEKDVENTKPDPLQSAFDRLRREVEKKRPQPTGKKGAGSVGATGGPSGTGGGGGGRQAELIDIYRYEVALQVQQNWAYSDQLAKTSKSLRVTIAFKVMPNGEIRDVFFDDRSGNRLLDESAYRAIMKANPVKPHPPGLIAPYVEVGLRFSPEGIQ